MSGCEPRATVPNTLREVVAWVAEKDVRVLNVAGNRESLAPGTGERTERFLARVFRQLAGGWRATR